MPEPKQKKTPAGGDKSSSKDEKPGCPWLCAPIPTNVPGPDDTQSVLHPRKDVFVLKVAKIGLKGERRCKMELELVTPKYQEKRQPYRVDTREAQCDPDPPPCYCCPRMKKKRK